MELSAALVADLSTLTEALDDADTDLAQTVLQLTRTAKEAVGSYLGLTIVATTGGRPVNLTALEHAVEPDEIRTSVRFPLGTPVAPPAEAGLAEFTHVAGVELIVYAGTPGALVDLAADLGWLTGRPPGDFVFDAHLAVAELNDELARARWTNQAIGVLIGRGYTPEHAEHEITALLTRTGWNALTNLVLTGLHDPDAAPPGP